MKVTIQKLRQWKQEGRAIVALTAYDYAMAKILDQGGVDLILVGDSLGMVVLGYETTIPVTLEDMIHHAKAVCRGVKQALVVVDLPFLTYQESLSQAMHSAGRILRETGAHAVKIEGGYQRITETVFHLTSAGVPVLGHVGLTPQSVYQFGGYRKQGKTPIDQERILTEAMALEDAGAFAIVLEHIPSEFAQKITEKLTIPTIGIGAGSHCDGQVLVLSDLLGLSEKQPPFSKSYTNLQEIISLAISSYSQEVKNRQFPPS